MGKIFKFMEFTFLENASIRGIFNVSPLSKLAPKFLSSHPRQKEITHSPGRVLSKICFSQQQNGFEETMICFNQLKNYLCRKICKNYYSMYIEERGWINTQILLANC